MIKIRFRTVICLFFALLIGGVWTGCDNSSCDDCNNTAILSCAELTTENLSLDNVEITSSALVTDDENYDGYCLVQGKVNERTGIDGKTYAIGFEMRLPEDWNERFLFQANGGNDGSVVPATGGVANASDQDTALARGFAVLSTDAGHNGSDPENASTGLAQGNVFGLDPQARTDYGYGTTLTMTPIAKAIIERHYGQAPVYSYMAGCSNGGRHAMVAASRFPTLFDGILAGDPGFNLPKAAVQHAWDVQSFRLVDPEIFNAFSTTDMQLVADAVVAACDDLDGAEDGMVADLVGCQDVFNLADLACPGAKDDTCLSATQVTALSQSMGGPKNSSDEQLYSDWPYDGGMGASNWRFWKLESGIPPWGNYPLIAIMGSGSLSYIFTTPPTSTAGDPTSLYNFLIDFDFDVDAPKIFATTDTFHESAMAFMTPPDVSNPTLAEFKAAGGKLILYHGQSDPVFSVNDTINWYEALTTNNGGDASDFARLFVIPGMTHCSGGCATDQFDALSALVDWVEDGTAPDRLIAALDTTNAGIPDDWDAGRTRPLCVWPKIATYVSGDIEDYQSFECATP
jgi:pimeloyl-ACP methyl ester carboxylesterase